MIMKMIIPLFYLINLSLIPSVQDAFARQSDYTKIGKLGFYYVIYHSDQISAKPDEPDSGIKRFHLLMDEEAFSKENLEELFRAFSQAFPHQETLEVFVLTNIKQVNLQGLFMSHSPTPPEYSHHHRALYSRDSKDEFFRYTQTPNSVKMETVILKGNKN
jgi:hypothetical protein